MEYLFLLVDLKNRPVLVVGGGNVAARKVSMLRRAGAKIQVVANSLCSELRRMECLYDDVIWIGKQFEYKMLNDAFLVIVATNNKNINDDVYRQSEAHHKFVNVVDDKSKCSLIFPAVIDRSPLIVAISSSGKAPVLVRILREKLESLLPNFLGPMANLIGSWRKHVKSSVTNIISRRRFWEDILHNDIFSVLVAQGLLNKAECFLYEALNDNKKISEMQKGNVALVGAGPGDSGLFTLRGLQLVQEADFVLYDSLVTSEILDLIRRDAKRIYVGKEGMCKENSMNQNQINHLLIKLAKEGNKVVRLKGGDPFIFGRGGEELEELMRAGVPCQVVPGVTAASSVAVYAGIPLTHRNYAHSVIFITGQFFCNSSSDLNFRYLSCIYQTLVIYMGAGYVTKIRTVLIKNGCDVNTPVAVISAGTSRNQKVLIGMLDNLEDLVKKSFRPSLLIIGKVVNLHYEMDWFNQEGGDFIKKYKFTSLINLF